MKKNKCNVVMLASKDISTLHRNQIWIHYNTLRVWNSPDQIIKSEELEGYCIPQHLYITSSIKGFEVPKGNWFYDTRDRLISNNSLSVTQFTKKVIATTDPELHKDGVDKIGLPFIEKYITEYNKGNVIKEVNVEYHWELKGQIYSEVMIPKLRSDGTIIIHKVQEVFTKEDMKNLYNSFRSMIPKILEGEIIDMVDFETWFEQNY